MVNLINITPKEKLVEILKSDFTSFTDEKYAQSYVDKIVGFIGETRLTINQLQTILDGILSNEDNLILIESLEQKVDEFYTNPYITSIKSKLQTEYYDSILPHFDYDKTKLVDKINYITNILDWSDSEVISILENIEKIYSENSAINVAVSGESETYKEKLIEITEILGNYVTFISVIHDIFDNHYDHDDENSIIRKYMKNVGDIVNPVSSYSTERKSNLIDSTLRWLTVRENLHDNRFLILTDAVERIDEIIRIAGDDYPYLKGTEQTLEEKLQFINSRFTRMYGRRGIDQDWFGVM